MTLRKDLTITMPQLSHARGSRARRGTVAAVSAIALLAACTGGGDDQVDVERSSEATADAPADVGPAPEGLEGFYDQSLEWEECDSFECSTLTVPIDYAEPDGETIELSVLRAPAAGSSQGSLVVNPGGPGASGVEYAKFSGMAIDSDVREVYDVVGFDPRGVAGSAPIVCYDDDQMDDMLGSDPTPDDDAERQEGIERAEAFAQACEERAGDLLGHVSTVEAATDMDVLRAALGESRLTYLGASYGTFLGATYAELFPDKVGRFVLDGAVDPTLTSTEMGLGQAEGFERATRAYVEDCVASGDCPLGDDVDTAMARIPAFLDELDSDPLPVSGDEVTELTEGWGMLGIIIAMYDQSAWPLLTQAFDAAFNGDGSSLMYLANLYADRSSDGSYGGNSMQAIYAVNCLDRPGEDGEDEAQVADRFEQVSPTWGRYLAVDGPCAQWPVQAQETLTEYDAEGAAPILVVGTTRDPATPYEWAEALADQLSSGVLLSYDGDGHTAYGRSNACVDDAVNAYLIDGTVPKDGLSC